MSEKNKETIDEILSRYKSEHSTFQFNSEDIKKLSTLLDLCEDYVVYRNENILDNINNSFGERLKKLVAIYYVEKHWRSEQIPSDCIEHVLETVENGIVLLRHKMQTPEMFAAWKKFGNVAYDDVIWVLASEMANK